MRMLLIFSSTKTARLEYILETLFGAAGVTFELTTSLHQFLSYQGSKINYSSAQISKEEYRIYPDNLLFENTVSEKSINCFRWKKTRAFFNAPSGDLPFDIFAASFYLLCRYEEYLPHDKDGYGRYAHTNSLAFREGFLQLPVINLWLQEFCMLLQKKFPSLSFNLPQFRFIPTYDIDIAWSYFSKGWIRNFGGFIKSFWKREWPVLEERMNVLLGNNDDPFDVYAWLDELHDACLLQPVYFFLLAQKTGKYDKNIHPKNRYFQLLISKLSAMYGTGIHPSWQSGNDQKLLLNEIQLLAAITRKEVINSRQHYIRMDMPATYQQLITAGIKSDYSMGYGSINGFRASYCLPYKWYDLSKEETTGLTLYPFCYMEANSIFEQHFTPLQALDELEHYYQVTKQVNGTLISIFHNHLLTLQPRQIEWRKMYEQFLKQHFVPNV